MCSSLQTLRAVPGGSEQEEVQVAVTRVLVDSYFDVVRKNFQDAVPKARRVAGSVIRSRGQCLPVLLEYAKCTQGAKEKRNGVLR